MKILPNRVKLLIMLLLCVFFVFCGGGHSTPSGFPERGHFHGNLEKSEYFLRSGTALTIFFSTKTFSLVSEGLDCRSYFSSLMIVVQLRFTYEANGILFREPLTVGIHPPPDLDFSYESLLHLVCRARPAIVPCLICCFSSSRSSFCSPSSRSPRSSVSCSRSSSSSCSGFWRTLLLLLSGIETNPGPALLSPFTEGTQSSLPSTPTSPGWLPFQSMQLISPPNYNRSSGFASPESAHSDQNLDIPVGTLNQPLIISANINSLTSKTELLRPLMQATDPLVVCLQETKLNAAVSSVDLKIPGYNFYRKDRNRNGGGVGIYVRDSVKCKKLRLAVPPTCEMVGVEISLKHRALNVISFYNPQKVQAPPFINDFADCLSRLGLNKWIVACGDSNVDFISDESSLFDPIIHGLNFEQLVSEPTHFGHCLDQIFVNKLDHCGDCGTAAPLEAQHSITWLTLNKSINKPHFRRIRSVKWELADWGRALAYLVAGPGGAQKDLTNEVENPDISVEQAADLLTAEILAAQCEALSDRAAVNVVRLRCDPCPWMTKALLRTIQRKHLTYRNYRRNPDPRSHSLMIKSRKMAKFVCKSAKKDYCQRLFASANTVKSYWTTVRRLLQTHASFPSLELSDGTVVWSALEKAESLAHEFSKNFNTEDNAPMDLNGGEISADWNCSEEEILNYIHLLDNSSAVGLDDISPRTLKECRFEIAPAISALCNRILQEGIFPAVLKAARIAPVPKVHGTNKAAEMRPISVLPAISKLVERWLLRCLHPLMFDPPDANQFAYLPGRSVDDALAMVQHYVSAGFASCPRVTKVAVISLDVRKAFDMVPKNCLINNLREEGLPPPLLRLLHSYLSDRRQTVRIEGELSSSKPVLSGVAQGSLLGPKLFIKYVSPILQLQLSEFSRLIAYADDLLLIKPIQKDSGCDELNADLEKIFQQYELLKLSINPIKSKYLLCTAARPHLGQVLATEPEINGSPIARVSTMNYLGVTFDHQLSFTDHALQVSSRTRKAIGALWRSVGRWAGRDTFSDIFSRTVLPILLHGLPLASPSTTRGWTVLEKTVRFAARLALNDFTSDYRHLLGHLRWKNVARLCVERQLLAVYKWQNRLRHFPTNVILDRPMGRAARRSQPNRNPHQLNVNDEVFLTGRPTMRECITSNPLHFAIGLWNNLPADLTTLDLAQFKTEIRKFELYRMLQIRGWNPLNGQRIAQLSEDYWDF